MRRDGKGARWPSVILLGGWLLGGAACVADGPTGPPEETGVALVGRVRDPAGSALAGAAVVMRVYDVTCDDTRTPDYTASTASDALGRIDYLLRRVRAPGDAACMLLRVSPPAGAALQPVSIDVSGVRFAPLRDGIDIDTVEVDVQLPPE
ncbi:MAG TPA: hypothetical protein VFS05_03930 [Gemmatimonadaceae bacterium]|nr:hypothetical protein [Gemmatimonadaceae bacterium]